MRITQEPDTTVMGVSQFERFFREVGDVAIVFREVAGPYVSAGPIVADLATRPQLDLGVSDEVDDSLPQIVGGLSVTLARSFRIIDPTLANPSSGHWEPVFRLFDFLL